MNSRSLRRLAGDHGSLHAQGLPPNYIFPPSSQSSNSCCDDLSSLEVLLAGPEGTAFDNGIFALRLTIPKEYPNAPPTATFRTKIWHPNVDEKGAVCVDTLKSGWDKNLGLRDVLVTISCLLIQPNPASALNAEAGRLIQDGEWEAFEKRARVMSNIHAAIPDNLRDAVREARRRGEDDAGDAMQPKKGKSRANVEKLKDKGKAKVKVTEIDVDEAENFGTAKAASRTVEDRVADRIPKPASSILRPCMDNIFGISTGQAESVNDMDIDDSLGTVVHHSDVSVVDFAEPVTPNSKTLGASNQSKQPAPVSEFVTPANDRSGRKTLAVPPVTQSPQSPSADLPPFTFSWMNTPQRARIHGKVVQRTAESLRRERQELKKMKAAGFSIEKYNRGQFGPRKGLMRL